jgi:signal transduction histidine kinase/ligand-binding sensor domain-containing protein
VRLMDRARSRGRHFLAPGIVLTWMLLAWRPCAFALDPMLDVSQYSHTAWKIRDGFSKGSINSIAQTPDGYLWLGTQFGLLRFDGVRKVEWQPPPDQRLPSNWIFSLLATHDGTLWIGTSKGLASWKDGRLTEYPELAGQYIFKLLEGHEGTVWASGMAVTIGRLCAIHKGIIQCYGEDGALDRGASTLFEDRKGNLWAGVKEGVWRWKPGPPKFYPLPGEPDGIQALGADDDGALLVGWNGGIHRFVDGKTEAFSLPNTVGQFRARRLLRDRDGGLWIGTQQQGLVHLRQGRTDVFSASDGLSGENVRTIFEDREGNIWVATTNGLDRFRDFAVATFSLSQGLSSANVGSVLADRDGSVWLSTYGGLNRWNNGQLTIYRERAGHAMTGVREIVGSGLPDKGLESLFQDDRGRIWVATLRGLGYLENGRFIPIKGVPGGNMPSIGEDTAGNLWIANERFGLFRWRRWSEVLQIPWARLGHKDHASALAADPVQGGIWLGFHLGGVAYFADGQVRASYSAAEGLGEGRVNHLRFDQDGALWAATEGGLSRLKNGRIVTLTSKNGLPCDTVHWSMEDDAHSFWLYTACGLARIARTEIDAWAAAVDKDKGAKRTIQATVFDSSDGVRSLPGAGNYSPQVAKSSDGKLWFIPGDGVSIVDPRHIPFNALPPPIHIEQITADRKTYDATSAANGRAPLPPLIRDLQIEYTALSLAAPEKVRFRYKLEGRDRDWQDVGDRRIAFYTDLPYGAYRFRVMACNNSGVWNEAGAFLDFYIEPAYYQTTWFLVSCAAAFLALLAALYQLRLRQAARRFNLRLEGRVAERLRIARDLHDTMLQSFQGVLLKFHAVTYLLPDRPAEARQKLESVIDQAQEAIVEGRDAVQGLRSSTVVTNELARAISTFGEELLAEQIGPQATDFRVIVDGASRDIVPLVRDEVYRIACEALHNAFRHAQAKLIEVEIQYARRQLRLRFRDDGKGIDPKILSEGGREGHFGLAGMYERAKLVGGKLAVLSKLDSGTEVELTIPASVAYAKSSATRRSLFSRKGT